MKLKELDCWYKDNEIALDDFMRSSGKNWGALAYDKKMTIYDEYIIESQKDLKKDHHAARLYHRLPEVINYFQRNQLNHESGDYRPVGIADNLWPNCFKKGEIT